MSSTPQLYWVGPDGHENVIPLVATEVLIGRRSDADIVLNNQHVSRHHAKLVKMQEGYFQVIAEPVSTWVQDILELRPAHLPRLVTKL